MDLHSSTSLLYWNLMNVVFIIFFSTPLKIHSFSPTSLTSGKREHLNRLNDLVINSSLTGVSSSPRKYLSLKTDTESREVGKLGLNNWILSLSWLTDLVLLLTNQSQFFVSKCSDVTLLGWLSDIKYSLFFHIRVWRDLTKSIQLCFGFPNSYLF